jgi:hypothetical protein
MSQKRSAQDTWDAILHEVAMDDADHGEDSESDQQWAQALADATLARLAEMRHRWLLKPPAPKRPVEISAALQAMDREALVSRLTQLLSKAGPSLQLAYRDLSYSSDDDLRLLVTILEQPSAAVT